MLTQLSLATVIVLIISDRVARLSSRLTSTHARRQDNSHVDDTSTKPVATGTQSVEPRQRMEAENLTRSCRYEYRVWYGRYESKPGLTQTYIAQLTRIIIWGKGDVTSICRHQHYILIVDDAAQFTSQLPKTKIGSRGQKQRVFGIPSDALMDARRTPEVHVDG
ncbi:hypothetical protein EDB84DRAFT_73972 [Lactarius hengduanensis]|nr:hypothetical protein EDB84DRAFT_73972 [Lactarius hengduanensis]